MKKYDAGHVWAYNCHKFSFNTIASPCMAVSLLNQWFAAMGRENWSYKKPEVAHADYPNREVPHGSLTEIVETLCAARVATHEALEEIIKFFRFDKAVPRTAKRAFGEKTYVSEPERMGSDFALLMLRLIHFLEKSSEDKRIQIEWDPEKEVEIPPYKFRFTNALGSQFLYLQELNDAYCYAVDSIAKEQPRVRLIDEKGGEYSVILPFWRRPRSPLVYRAPASGPAATSRKRKFCRIDKRKRESDDVHEVPKSAIPVEFPSYRDNFDLGERPIKHFPNEDALTGMCAIDLLILEFLTAADIYPLQDVSPHMRDFIGHHCRRQLRWAVDGTKLLQDFFREEHGRVHLLLSSWGNEYVEGAEVIGPRMIFRD